MRTNRFNAPPSYKKREEQTFIKLPELVRSTSLSEAIAQSASLHEMLALKGNQLVCAACRRRAGTLRKYGHPDNPVYIHYPPCRILNARSKVTIKKG